MITTILANAFAATGATPWHIANRTRSGAGGRARLFAWLHWTAGLSITEVARVTNHERSSIYDALDRPKSPLVDPPESFRRAMAGVQAPIWARNGFGCLHKRKPFPALRRAVWSRMREDGCSLKEIGRLCGCSAQAIRDGMARGLTLEKASVTLVATVRS